MPMCTSMCRLLVLSLILAAPAAAQPKDAPGCTDDPIFPTRMPAYRIEKCETRQFGSFDFLTAKPPRRTVEGAVTSITYVVDNRADDRSGLEVVRNYESALRSAGGTVQASDPQRWVNGSLRADGREVWAQVEKGNGKIWLTIVRREAMDQVIVADAAALGTGLRATGHVTVNGIYFDTGKSDLKPESAAAVSEVAKLLQADPGLRLFVVGHTDGVGTVEGNLKLSQGRAEAVLASLVRDHGVAADRLLAFGNGPFAPVASNATDEGRASNRRVELVQR